MSVTRRGFLHSSVALVGGIGLASVVTKEASAKVAPNLVAYQDDAKGRPRLQGLQAVRAAERLQVGRGRYQPFGLVQAMDQGLARGPRHLDT